MTKYELFEKFQTPLLAVANNSIGRRALGINKEILPNTKILALTPNSYIYRNKKRYTQVFRAYDLFGNRLTTLLKVASFSLVPLFSSPSPMALAGLIATDFYAGAGDGQVEGGNTGTWSTAHDETSGAQGADYTGTTMQCGVDKTDKYFIKRSFLPIDTTSLPSSAVISAGSLSLYCTSKRNNDDDGDDWVNVVQTTQASTTQLVADDYDQCGSVTNPTEGGTRVDITSISTTARFTVTLNATGLSWVVKGGTTKLGLREGHDALNHEMSSGNDTGSKVTMSTSEQTGTTQDPYLSLTYEIPGGGMPFFFS